MFNAKILCERYDSLSTLVNCRRCEHVRDCASFDEHVEGQISYAAEHYMDIV